MHPWMFREEKETLFCKWWMFVSLDSRGKIRATDPAGCVPVTQSSKFVPGFRWTCARKDEPAVMTAASMRHMLTARKILPLALYPVEASMAWRGSFLYDESQPEKMRRKKRKTRRNGIIRMKTCLDTFTPTRLKTSSDLQFDVLAWI